MLCSVSQNKVQVRDNERLKLCVVYLKEGRDLMSGARASRLARQHEISHFFAFTRYPAQETLVVSEIVQFYCEGVHSGDNHHMKCTINTQINY